MKRFHSNGKFLITGEYLVLAGAKAFAAPLKVGQRMDVDTEGRAGQLLWTAEDPDGTWFTATLALPDLQILETNSPSESDFLAKALRAARELNPSFLPAEQGYQVYNDLEFSRNWGMGSSSTFLANLAKWAGVNAFDLHSRLSAGSGYDIACAYADSPVLYEKKFEQVQIESVKWSPPFHKQIAFVYLGKKQNTEKSIINFRELDIRDRDIRQVSKLSEEFWLVSHPEILMEKIREHEELISRIINRRPIQDELFRDFNGAVKSLGAWGGDFVMALSHDRFGKIEKYFQRKGYSTVLPWHIIL